MTTSALDLDQARADVAVAASRNQRRNRPTHLVVLAIALAAVSLIALLFMLQRRNDAKTAMSKERGVGDKATELVAQLRELKAAEDSTSVRYGGAESELTPSKFKNAANAVGLKHAPALPLRQAVDKEISGVHRLRWTYEVKDESMPNLMKWVQQVVRDIPGLEVYSISLKPEATQWSLKVTFSHWERAEQKK